MKSLKIDIYDDLINKLGIEKVQKYIKKQVDILREVEIDQNEEQESYGLRGILSEYSNPELIQEEKNAWKTAVKKKNGHKFNI